MRAPSFAALLLLAVALAPTASASHGPVPPNPTLDGTCPALPLWDAALCTADVVAEWTLAMVPWAIDATEWTVELVGCDVVGGPACPAPAIFGPQITD